MRAVTPTSLTVLESFPPPRPKTNPYVIMLADALTATPGLRMLHFSWRAAILGRYDVFHVHWPELLASGQSPLKRIARQVLLALLLLRLWVTRTPVVRTRHNLGTHEGLTRREAALLRSLEHLTRLSIVINPVTAQDLGSQPTVEILHGHYRDWFDDYPRTTQVTGRLAYFGLVRRYKNVTGLVSVFRELAGPYSLAISGNPHPEDLVGEIEALAAGDERIVLDLRFLADAELVSAVSEAELVVLPYREMHNSGSVLAALSLDRPVLVPANFVNDRLADEVGESWVLRYDELSAATLESALGRLAAQPLRGRPDLSGREWAAAGTDHLAAFRQAVAGRRSPSPAGTRR
jgi:beta-1,4-mannosyltransferase